MSDRPGLDDAVNQLAPTIDGIGADQVDGKSAEETPAQGSRVVLQSNRVGRFALIREIGSGGMGSVFAAYDEQLDRKVALKILRRGHAGNETQRLLTLREARAAARISHPNVIAVYEVGESGGQIHIAMEYVEGCTLLRWQTATRRDWHEILGIYLQVGEALLAAHEAQVVHRDFKPDNVLIGSDGRPRVVDFGLARVGWVEASGDELTLPQGAETDTPSSGSGRLTMPGIIAGTPGYMSPEQYRGGDVDSRSDQWSFCAALYEALYGSLPFTGQNLVEHAENVHGTPRPPPAGTQVPAEVHRALCRGLSPDPAQRFPSMAELLAVLRQEHSGNEASGALSRQRVIPALLALVLIPSLFLQLRHAPMVVTTREAVFVSITALVVILLCGLWQRSVLLRNRLHRNVWMILLVVVSQNLLARLFGWRMGMPLRQIFPFEMVGVAGSMTILTTLHFRSFRWLIFLPLGTAVISFTSIPRHLLVTIYPIIMVIVIIAWTRAARAASQSKNEKDSSGHFRRTVP